MILGALLEQLGMHTPPQLVYNISLLQNLQSYFTWLRDHPGARSELRAGMPLKEPLEWLQSYLCGD